MNEVECDSLAYLGTREKRRGKGDIGVNHYDDNLSARYSQLEKVNWRVIIDTII